MNVKRLLAVLGLFVLLSLTVGLYNHRQTQAQGNTCTVVHDKTANPTKVTEGGVVDITLTVRATGCDATTSPVDVILVLDRSGSMGGSKIAAAKQAAIQFVNQMGANDQVGVVSFNQTASLNQQLTTDKNSAVTAINGLTASGTTDIADGIVTAETELKSNRHRNNNAPVMIVLSDGRHNNGANLLQTATTVKNSGIEIITIGLGTDADEQQLRKVASSDNLYRYAPSASDLAGIYQSILQTSLRWAARNMVITDQLSDKVTLIPNSFSGPIAPTVNNNQLTWDVGTVPTDTISLSYKVAMTKDPGTWPTNATATGDYDDSSGTSRSSWR